MAKPEIPEGATYSQQAIRCGNPRCKSCPHGPYWYAYWRGHKGRSRSAYVGKNLPAKIEASAIRPGQHTVSPYGKVRKRKPR